MKNKIYVFNGSLPNTVVEESDEDFFEVKQNGEKIKLEASQIKEFKNEVKLKYWQTVKSIEEAFAMPFLFDTDYIVL